MVAEAACLLPCGLVPFLGTKYICDFRKIAEKDFVPKKGTKSRVRISSEIYVAHKVLDVCMVLKDPAHQALGDDVSIVSTCELIQL